MDGSLELTAGEDLEALPVRERGFIFLQVNLRDLALLVDDLEA